MPARRLLFPLLLSLWLHAIALGAGDLLALFHPSPPRPTPAMLNAVLQPAVITPDPLLKDTIADADKPPQPRNEDESKQGRRRSVDSAQRKLAEHLYYPEEAVARGIEGEVQLLLRLETGGRIADAQVAVSSGHPILDQAAVRAAYAMGGLPGEDRHELILPVTFRLR